MTTFLPPRDLHDFLWPSLTTEHDRGRAGLSSHETWLATCVLDPTIGSGKRAQRVVLNLPSRVQDFVTASCQNLARELKEDTSYDREEEENTTTTPGAEEEHSQRPVRPVVRVVSSVSVGSGAQVRLRTILR